mmetsp:Transcript_11828/g.30095  ORF Transcript_11828/g.30095 Transcript_11828/m.30095 type:complete len:284 (+) Transcript_11828:328-1179(+)
MLVPAKVTQELHIPRGPDLARSVVRTGEEVPATERVETHARHQGQVARNDVHAVALAEVPNARSVIERARGHVLPIHAHICANDALCVAHQTRDGPAAPQVPYADYSGQVARHGERAVRVKGKGVDLVLVAFLQEQLGRGIHVPEPPGVVVARRAQVLAHRVPRQRPKPECVPRQGLRGGEGPRRGLARLIAPGMGRIEVWHAPKPDGGIGRAGSEDGAVRGRERHAHEPVGVARQLKRSLKVVAAPDFGNAGERAGGHDLAASAESAARYWPPVADLAPRGP